MQLVRGTQAICEVRVLMVQPWIMIHEARVKQAGELQYMRLEYTRQLICEVRRVQQGPASSWIWILRPPRNSVRYRMIYWLNKFQFHWSFSKELFFNNNKWASDLPHEVAAHICQVNPWIQIVLTRFLCDLLRARRSCWNWVVQYLVRSVILHLSNVLLTECGRGFFRAYRS